MNLLSRVYYSLRNNLSKTVILFLVVFILGNVICGSLAITQSLENTQNEFRKHYGSKVEISLLHRLEAATYMPEREDLKLIKTRLEELANHEKIKYSYKDINYYFSGMTSNMLTYEDEMENLEIKMCGITNPHMGLFKNYKLELIEGRSFNDEEMENGSNVVLISDSFEIIEDGERRKIGLGDKIELTRNAMKSGEHISEKIEYEVIGIYKRYDNVMVINDGYTFDNHIARLYVPYSMLVKEEERINQLEGFKQNRIILGNVYLQMEDDRYMLNVENYMRKYILEHSLLKEIVHFESTNEIYQKISAPIESMSGIADFLLISSCILCILILSVSVFILIRNRKHEIGILISLGESKFKVILQIVLEIYLTGMLALGFSMVSGNELGKIYSNYLVSEQVEESRQDLSIDEVKLQDELMKNYSFELSKEYIINVIFTGSIVLLLSVSIPVGYIVQLKPRKILL